MLELEGDKPRENGGGVQLTDDRLQVGKATCKGMHRRDVAEPGRRQCRKTKIEHRVNFGKAADRGGEVSKAVGIKSHIRR